MINAYDFDDTIYDGDSSIDFYKYCLKRNKKVLLFLPVQLLGIILYILKIIDKTRLKEKLYSFLKVIDNVDSYIDDFWKEKKRKIKKWYLNQKEKSDVIISASPEFLLKPLEKILDVKIIASKVDKKTGKFLSKNCHDIEKIKRYEEKYKKKIRKFYSDSIKADRPMFEYSQEAYLVKKNDVKKIDINTYSKQGIKEKILKTNNVEKYLFIFSMLTTLILGAILFYNYDFTNNYNLLFDSDTARVVADATSYGFLHYRSAVHPLFILLIQPIFTILKGITSETTSALIVLSSIITSTTVVYIYKSLKLLQNNPKQNILISLIYLFTFGNIVFTSGIEVYNIAALFLVLLWYYYILKRNTQFDKYSYIILIFLGISSAAITITNFVIYLIVLGVLFITKKINIKKSIIVLLVTVLSIGLLNSFQHFIWKTTPLLWEKEITKEEKYISLTTIGFENIKNVVKNDYYNSLLSSDMRIKVINNFEFHENNYVLVFKDLNYINIIIISIFYILLILLIIRNIKKELFLNLGLLAVLAFNTLLHIIYGNDSSFLYSLHFIYPVILLYGINLIKENNTKLKKIINTFLLIFLFIQLIINSFFFIKILKIIRDILKHNYIIEKYGLLKTIIIESVIITLIVIVCYIIYAIIKRIKTKDTTDKKIVLKIVVFLLVLSIESIFICICGSNNTNNYAPYTNNKYYYLEDDFKNYYKNELDALNEYNEEYKLFKAEYSPSLNSTISEYRYYYFGFGNRRKLLYKQGVLMDIFSEKVLYRFKEEESVIIPNLYTVIIKTEDNKYIKIYEDENGVHYKVGNKDSIISGTNKKIKLYDFDNQEYHNIKKVLYGEILFNIKDSKIYPNIIVYNKPWYRDAAITSMVLRQTDNVDLISEWINSIDELYDKNNGVEEPDNLGQVLYLLSLQENKNYDLINRIEEEAEKNANKNPDGYYIAGKTDFTDQHLYQNLWYKLGIESVGRDYHFDIDKIEEDHYSKGAWWSDYETSHLKNEDSNGKYPYLSYAIRHKQKEGNIIVNEELYPLSWEINASEANYNNYSKIFPELQTTKTSPLHTWAAAELLLFILDETNDLNYAKLK